MARITESAVCKCCEIKRDISVLELGICNTCLNKNPAVFRAWRELFFAADFYDEWWRELDHQKWKDDNSAA